MEVITDFYLFLISVVFISFSGVMAPGPLFAVTIAKSLDDKKAGVLISFGHGIVEFPLVFLIYFGFIQFLASSLAQKIIGLIGGLIMIYMGFRMAKTERKNNEEYKASGHSSVWAGALATGANPYFLLWWVTIGSYLVLNAQIFGFIGFLVFIFVHWLCDLVWNSFVSLTVFKSKRFLTGKMQKIIFAFCFFVLISFGFWFVISAII